MKKILILITFLVVLCLFLTGCSECDLDTDCEGELICKDGNCIKRPFTPNVCGNGKCELNAPKPENNCNCVEDCKPPCAGKVSFKNSRGRNTDAQYLEQLCENNKCVYSVDPENVKLKRKIFEPRVENGLIELEVTTEYNFPFKMNKDKFKVTFKLKDKSENFVPPFKIESVKFIQGDNLYGKDGNLNILFSKMDDEPITIEVLSDADLMSPEESARLELQFDYIIKKKVGEETQEIRNSYSHRFGETMYFIETGEVK